MTFLKSRTFYTLVALFLFNGLQALQPQVSGDISLGINFVLGCLALYFKLYPSQAYSGYIKE